MHVSWTRWRVLGQVWKRWNRGYCYTIKETKDLFFSSNFCCRKSIRKGFFVVPPSFGFCLHLDPCLMLFTTISIYILVMGLLFCLFLFFSLKIHLKREKKRADTKECLMMIASKKIFDRFTAAIWSIGCLFWETPLLFLCFFLLFFF